VSSKPFREIQVPHLCGASLSREKIRLCAFVICVCGVVFLDCVFALVLCVLDCNC
jgi:hypothetical protein